MVFTLQVRSQSADTAYKATSGARNSPLSGQRQCDFVARKSKIVISAKVGEIPKWSVAINPSLCRCNLG